MIQRALPELVAQMRRAAETGRGFVADMDEAAFLADLKTQWAVLMSLLIVGEMAARIMDAYPDAVTRNASIPWRNIRGMRNRIAHSVFGLDAHIVWEALHDSLPDLIAQLDCVS